MSKPKHRKYYLLLYSTPAIMLIIAIPFMIIADVPFFIIIFAIILALLYFSSCYAVLKKGYKNVPPQITFPVVTFMKKNGNHFTKITSKKKKQR